MKLKDKIAIITGAGGAIGKAASLLFAQEGASIIVVDINQEAAKETDQEIKAQGGTSKYFVTDISQGSGCQGMIEFARSEFGGLHVLFNNAGVMHPDDGDTQQTPETVWDSTMDINAKGVYLGCKFGIPLIQESGGGTIINTASFVARLGAATPQIAYTASKGAVLALTRELAVLHARDNIRINALCPGPLYTEMLMKFLNSEEKKQRRLVHIPMGRFGEAEEMAKAALFLASEDSSYMTGAELLVDGGITAAYVTPE